MMNPKNILSSKVDYACILAVNYANPNGDPVGEGKPRQDAFGFGFISDVCLKRKTRNRLADLGAEIFVKSNDRNDDGYQSLQARAEAQEDLQKLRAEGDVQGYADLACEKWLDTRAFGQLFAWGGNGKGKGKKGKKSDEGETETSSKDGSVSIGIRGPMTIRPAFSISPIEIEEMGITKSTNGKTEEKGGRASDTMGTKTFVRKGIYVAYGSINSRQAEKTGLTEEDVELIRKAMETMMENDESAARPSGSIQVLQVIWWRHTHKDGDAPSGVVHRSLHVEECDSDTPADIGAKISVRKLKGIDIGTMEYGLPVEIIE